MIDTPPTTPQAANELSIGALDIYYELAANCDLQSLSLSELEDCLKTTFNASSQILHPKFIAEYQTNILSISIIICDNNKIKQLNHTYRNINKPTNALSFPGVISDHNDTFHYLGDVIISLDTILSEAKSQNKNPYHHFAHILVHSILHLLGYSHENDQDEHLMIEKELEILEKLAKNQGIPFNNPYMIID